LLGQSTCLASHSVWASACKRVAGAQASQQDFMQRDECILVDEADVVAGHANKYACHRFVPGQPRGQLHRAFSVFLFDAQVCGQAAFASV
jgi:hypothetical protein